MENGQNIILGRPLNVKKKNRFLSNRFVSNRFEPCFPLQNYRFSAQIDYNRWSVRKRTIDRYNCQIRNITIPVIDLSRFFGKSLRVWVVERARIFTQRGFKVLTVCGLGFRVIGMEEVGGIFIFLCFPRLSTGWNRFWLKSIQIDFLTKFFCV